MNFELKVVLVRPRNPLNIGAAARAMANFGFRDLAVVEAYEPAWQEARSAVGAEEVLRSARSFADLSQAVADCTLVAGTTSGSRRKLGRPLLPLPELPARITRKAKVAMLFGSEKTGLLNEHLGFCHLVTRIPTVPACPSMNLGQAVAVCCYELRRAATAGLKPGPTASRAASIGDIEQLRAELEETLRGAGYFPWPARRSDAGKLRRLLLRLHLGIRDLATLRGMVAQLRWKQKSSDK